MEGRKGERERGREGERERGRDRKSGERGMEVRRGSVGRYFIHEIAALRSGKSGRRERDRNTTAQKRQMNR